MKKILSLLFVLVGMVSTAFAQKAQPAPTDALLYKISGKNLKSPSYLFGTIHIVCPNEMIAGEKLNVYLDQTERLMMELDMDDPAVMSAMGQVMVMTDGKTLKDYLNAEQYAKVDAMFKDYMGMSVDNLKQIKPFALSLMIATSPKALGCKPDSYELTLVKSATEKKKSVEGLETVASQIAVLDRNPVAKQAEALYKMSLDPQKGVGDFRTLTNAYKMQDSEALYKVMSEQMKAEGGADAMKYLLDDRNAAWIPLMEKAMTEKSTFFAVGGGHLGGTKGVVKLLKQKGYKIEAIKL